MSNISKLIDILATELPNFLQDHINFVILGMLHKVVAINRLEPIVIHFIGHVFFHQTEICLCLVQAIRHHVHIFHFFWVNVDPTLEFVESIRVDQVTLFYLRVKGQFYNF